MAKKKAFQIASDAQTVSSLAALARVHLEVANTDISELKESVRNMARSAADASLIELAEQRVGLLRKKAPLKAECERLWDVAMEAWRATGLSIDADPQRWKNHLECYGYIAAENADNEIQDKINALDKVIRSIPATTLAGLVVKFEVVRHTMNISDDEPRIDQDLDVLLFNEFSDELGRVASGARPGALSPIKEYETGHDPLIDAIAAYRDGMAQLNAIPEEQITKENENALIAGTYEVPMHRLLDWDKPALTTEGAIEALRLMSEEDVFVDDMGEPLRRAVLGYLESLQRQTANTARIATPKFEPSDIFYCLLDLDQQMQAIYDILHELEYVRQDGTRIFELDRIAGMFRIASKEVERIRDLASVFDGPANLKNLLAGLNE